MSESKDKEIYYCTHCGAANKKSAVECTECERKIITKYRPFYDFLKNHSKQEAGEKAVDTVFGLIRRFLMSHIYGIALSVTIVAAGVITVLGTEPHIKEASAPVGTVVTSAPNASKPQEVTEKKVEVSEEDLELCHTVAVAYDYFSDSYRAVPDMDSTYDHGFYTSIDEVYAEKSLDGFPYAGKHELISNPISINGVTDDPKHSKYNAFHFKRELDFDSALGGEDCTSKTAKKLCADGYNVIEANYVISVGAGVHGEVNTTTGEGYTVIRRLTYDFVFVEKDDNWYIVEDRLLENYSV